MENLMNFTAASVVASHRKVTLKKIQQVSKQWVQKGCYSSKFEQCDEEEEIKVSQQSDQGDPTNFAKSSKSHRYSLHQQSYYQDRQLKAEGKEFTQIEGEHKEKRNYQRNKKGGVGFTHFLSLPIASDNLKKVYAEWRDNIVKQNYETIWPKLFLDPRRIHFTLCMLRLENEEQIEQARQAMKTVEVQIQTLINENGQKGKLMVEFDQLHYFGKPEDTRVIYLKLKEEGDQYQLLLNVVDILVRQMLESKVIPSRNHLDRIKLNKQTNRYEPEQLHLTLINSSFGMKDLLRNYNRRSFFGALIIDQHFQEMKEQLELNGVGTQQADTIELSTRFHYDERGFYSPQYVIKI